MSEYQFRTTKQNNISTGIFRVDERPSGLVVPFSIAQISYANLDGPASVPGLRVPSRQEAALYGIDTEPSVDDVAPSIDRYTFTDTSLTAFGRRALQTCMEIIDVSEATNVVIVVNPEIQDDGEKDLLHTISKEIARHSAGYHGDDRPDLPIGQYL